MMFEAKYRIGLIFDNVEQKMSSKKDVAGLQKLNELKRKINTSMGENNDLKKWSNYKTTDDFHSIVSDFSDELWNGYPEMAVACSYFQKPCFFNED